MMELRTIPVAGAEEETFIIYRPLIGLAFIGNRALVDLAYKIAESPQSSLHPDIAQFLQSIGFFQPDPLPPEPPQGKFAPLGVTLLLTNQCQLRCIYCYAAAGEFTRQVLPLEYGRLAIDYAVEAALRRGATRLDVALHGGGEPTLPWRRLVSLVAYARQQPLPVSISLTSNGIWSRAQTHWILANIDAVTISMDGSPETQNHQRPLASGEPSSKWVLRTIRELDSHPFNYTIRMTALPPWGNLVNDVRFLCENSRCAYLHVEPAFNIRRGEECSPRADDVHGFTHAFMEAFQIATKAQRRLVYSGAALENITASFCSSGYSSLIVTPEGSLVACYTVTNSSHPLAQSVTIGKICEGRICIDEPARSRMHQLLSERRKACRTCFCYWSCAGDCFAKFLTPKHGGHMVFDGRCEINRSLLRDLMLQGMARNNGIWLRYTPCRHSPAS